MFACMHACMCVCECVGAQFLLSPPCDVARPTSTESAWCCNSAMLLCGMGILTNRPLLIGCSIVGMSSHVRHHQSLLAIAIDVTTGVHMMCAQVFAATSACGTSISLPTSLFASSLSGSPNTWLGKKPVGANGMVVHP
jgi:hypothetical protein